MPVSDLFPRKRRLPVALFGFPIKHLAIALAVVIGLGIYMSMLLFGPDSLTVLLRLEEEHAAYNRYIKQLKEQNAKLQKEFFELKQLEPDS